jgi:hypothetical protein
MKGIDTMLIFLLKMLVWTLEAYYSKRLHETTGPAENRPPQWRVKPDEDNTVDGDCTWRQGLFSFGRRPARTDTCVSGCIAFECVGNDLLTPLGVAADLAPVPKSRRRMKYGSTLFPSRPGPVRD